MKFWEEHAIKLKYQGRTHRQIADEVSKLTKVKVSHRTIDNYFTVDGKWYIPYLEYEAEQNKWNDLNSKQEMKRLSALSAKVRKQILKKAMETGDYRLALDTLKDIDDRAGNVVVRVSKINVETTERKPIDTYDEFVKELERAGIDPRTGLRVAKAPLGEDQSN